MKNLTVMLKPASSACNLRCRYCFYADVSRSRSQYSYGMMSEDTADALLKNIFSFLEAGDSLCLSFQGGEPTLAGLDFFRRFVDIAAQKNASIGVRLTWALQTNGLLIDEDWCAFLREHRFLVGLSMDASPELHDRNRIDAAGKGTWRRVRQTRRLLEKHGIEYNVLAVLTSEMARHSRQVWDFIQRENIEYLQLIPCLGELDAETRSPYALTPKRFASFYTQLFSCWLEAYQKGAYRSVKLFDDLVNLLAAGIQSACGMTGECVPQLVVEADGSVYPCDFYMTDEYRLGNLAEQALSEIFASPAREAFCRRAHRQPRLCADCRYRSICGGGCKRMQQEVCCSENDDTCGYQDFLDRCLPGLQRIAAAVQRRSYRSF